MALYLGLDSSTQGLKALIADTASGEIVAAEAVNFGTDLPEYNSPSGFLPAADPLVRRADPRMWLAALDLVFDRLSRHGAPLERVEGVSGSGQQHGTVYLNADFPELLRSLPGAEKLAVHLAPALSRREAPIWMDRSTARECAELTRRFGAEIQRRTGSPATERFSGPQIRKFAADDPEAWEKTACVHLVSSFLASVLAGQSQPIDYGDGAGMNLLNLETLNWDDEITNFTAPHLREKLPSPVPGSTVSGSLSPYFGRWGLRPGIPVVVWSGDNPSSLVGVGGALPGKAVISLGTSDTFFAAMRTYRTDPEGCGHVFGNPAGGFMSLICFTNGSLARERVRQECGFDYREFDRPGDRTPGRGLILPYFDAESTPPVLTPGIRTDFDWQAATPRERVKALLKSQALTMKLHSAWQDETFSSVTVTGGASKSPAFREILADVFQARIDRLAVADSAALGAAMRAAEAVGGESFSRLGELFCRPVESTEPDPRADYRDELRRYTELENRR